MTLVFDAGVLDQPGTHVLAMGVGAYTHLLGGALEKMANRPLGLGQLDSPPVSLAAFLRWLLAPVSAAGAIGFVNNQAPLASIDALASAPVPLQVDAPGGTVTLAAATRSNIQAAFEDWLGRVNSNPDNIGIFYFCGHGIVAADHYLLADDFGQSAALPWTNAFDISTTIRALEREVQGTVYYFIDACREISREVAMTLGGSPSALHIVDLSKRVSRRSVTAVFATGEGALAYAPAGGVVSRFTNALICALSGYCGTKPSGAPLWEVDGETLARAIRKLLEYETLDTTGVIGTPTQVTDQWTQGPSVPLLRLGTAPRVKVWLNLLPPDKRLAYELYLRSASGVQHIQDGVDHAFKLEVTRGFYEVGARGLDGHSSSITYLEEELMPPCYPLIMQPQS
ncbi:caspase family protein [Pseudomonas faucium]|uniref:caspase family protein n=1 Tax=Pseudomonas faucium TaxID=2740518 RepID=UPI0039C313DA